MKYVIDMEDKPCDYENGRNYYRCKQISYWQLSESTLRKLDHFDTYLAAHECEAEQRSVEKVWKVWKLAHDISEMSASHRIACFGTCSLQEIFGKPLPEIREKYEDWKADENTFRVGDEVTDDKGREAYVLVANATEEDHLVLMEGYAAPQYVFKKDWHKTGQRSTSLIEQIKRAAEQIEEYSGDRCD